MSRYRIWVEQVNQQMFDITAKDEEEAYEKGYRIWRRNYAHSLVGAVEKIEDEK